MTQPLGDSLNENKIDPSKNSAKNIEYYDALVKAFEDDESSTLLKLRSFALYTPRQVASDFLARFELFKMIADLPGSIFELGVFNGQGLMSYALFSSILEPNFMTRRIFGFDTFGGFAEIAESDAKSRSSFMHEGGYAVNSRDRLERSIGLYDMNRFIGHVSKVELVTGDVCESLPKFLEENPQVIPALVHLDMDVFRPTKVALELLLPRMPRGAVVAFDELNMKDFPGETAALMDVVDMHRVSLKKIPFCSRISYFRIE